MRRLAAVAVAVALVALPATAWAKSRPVPIYPVASVGATVAWDVSETPASYVYFVCSGILAGPPVALGSSPRLPVAGAWTAPDYGWAGTVQCNGYAVRGGKRDTLVGYLDYWQFVAG